MGLGSNLDDPVRHVRRAFADLQALPGCIMTARSPLFRSAPIGPPGQGWYVNAVAAMDVSLEARDLLDALRGIEDAHDRDRSVPRWGPRTLDLDLLLYGDLEIEEPDLRVPHPGLTNRNFVVYPLLLVAPDLVLPDGRSLTEVAAALDVKGLERMGDD